MKRSNTFQEKVISSLDKPSLSIPGAYGVLVVVQSLSSVRLSVTPWAAAHQASWSFTISWSPLKLMSIEPLIPSNHLLLCHSLLLLPSIFPSIRVFSSEPALHIRWPKYWSFSFSISSSSGYSGLISFRPGWISLMSKGHSSPAPQFKSINSLALSLFYVPALTTVYD